MMPPITGGDVKSIAAVHLRERKGARTQKKRYVSFKWGSSPPLIFVIHHHAQIMPLWAARRSYMHM